MCVVVDRSVCESSAPHHFARAQQVLVATLGGVKGDSVEVLIDAGAGVQRFEITASRAGRRVEVANLRGTVEVTEVTRGGTPVRTARFMASKVVAVVEHRASDGRAQGAAPVPQPPH